MRWKQHKWERPAPRIRSRFLLIPKTIGGETRWLCRATWRERWERWIDWDCDSESVGHWSAEGWEPDKKTGGEAFRAA